MKRQRSSSQNREHVYRALRSARRPMSAYQVLDHVREHGISTPPAVYRALDYLIDSGQVHRLESINAYVACSDPDHAHDTPVFAICTSCDGIAELPGGRVIETIATEAGRAGFAMRQAAVEIKGLCGACRVGNADPAMP